MHRVMEGMEGARRSVEGYKWAQGVVWSAVEEGMGVFFALSTLDLVGNNTKFEVFEVLYPCLCG